MASDPKALIGVVLHRPDYRGDHAADVEEVIILPPETTLKELQDCASNASDYGFCWIVVPQKAKL